jgi:hypothetical protein
MGGNRRAGGCTYTYERNQGISMNIRVTSEDVKWIFISASCKVTQFFTGKDFIKILRLRLFSVERKLIRHMPSSADCQLIKEMSIVTVSV